MKSSGVMFVKENTGNIKDFYKISSCIGRGKYLTLLHYFKTYKVHLVQQNFYLFSINRCLWRGSKMSLKRYKSTTRS